MLKKDEIQKKFSDKKDLYIIYRNYKEDDDSHGLNNNEGEKRWKPTKKNLLNLWLSAMYSNLVNLR